MMGMASGVVSLLECGDYTPTEDVKAKNTKVYHNLGVAPDFIIYFADEFEADASWTTVYIRNASFLKYRNAGNGYGIYINTRPGYTSNVITNYWLESMTNFCKADYFIFPAYNVDHKLKAGVTYHWAIGKIANN